MKLLLPLLLLITGGGGAGAPDNNDLFKTIVGKVTKLKSNAGKPMPKKKARKVKMNQGQQNLANYTGVAPQVLFTQSFCWNTKAHANQVT